MNGFGTLYGQYVGCSVVVSLPTVILQSTQDLGNLAHRYFNRYLHQFPYEV